MLQMVASGEQTKFGLDKRDTLPQYCLDCDVRFACHGECPKNRFIATPDGEPGLNYLCAGYKGFFHRVNEPLKILTMLMRSGRPASDVMAIVAEREAHFPQAFAQAGADDPCPCGSEMLFKSCHGWQPAKRSRRRRTESLAKARPPVRESTTK
jgi:uncharacterized protein